MNKKEVNKIITVGLTTSIVLSPFSEGDIVVNANGLKNNYSNALSSGGQVDATEVKEVYLSDIPYDSSQSRVDYGSIMEDANVEGDRIRLLVDGNIEEFKKGIGAHATSTLVYDISAYSSEYTRFITHLGVDASRVDNGDGVSFSIFTSVDGSEWKLVKKTGLLKGNTESVYVDINLDGANYIKLYAYDNGDNSSDHSVYGGAKLVKSDYSISDITIPNLYPVSYYDAILSNESIDKNIEDNKNLILQRAFVDRVGYASIQRLFNKGQKYIDGIDYIFNNETALEYFITNGPVNVGGSFAKSLQYFCDIYEMYADELKDTSDNNFNLRLAVSISLGYSRDAMVSSWMPKYKEVNSVERYDAYQELISSGRMDAGGNQDGYGKWSSEEFKKLPIPMMKWVVDSRINNDEIFWLADYALKQKEDGKDYLDGYLYIDYDYSFGFDFNNPEYYKEENREMYNNKYDFESYYDDYGNTDVNRMWMVFEEGAVCGGITQTYANLSEVFGRPSSPCGQPAHAAAVTWGWNKENQRYEWMIQNNAWDWTNTGNQFDDRMLGWGTDWNDWYNASYTILATDAIYDANYMDATMLNLLADSYSDNAMKKEAYEKALDYQSINYDSIIGLINCYKKDSNITAKDYFNLAKQIISTYTYYPQVMMDVLSKIEANITDVVDAAKLDLLKNEALVKASKATVNESSNVGACTQLANHYLGNEDSAIATFSFDGENANKIILSDKYADSTIRVRYSLDGEVTWKYTNEKVITLTEDEVNSISADKDIVVGLVGVDTTYTIDILHGEVVNSNKVYGNDNENVLIGELDNLEFSIDNGQTWHDYVENNNTNRNYSFNRDSEGRAIFDGAKIVKLRYKANGVKLQSNAVEYRFTENNNTDRKYVPIKSVSLVECSTPNADDTKGEHLLDGTPNTQYHTTYGVNTPDKFFTVKFDKVRYITSMEYHSNSYNGKFQTGKILTSLDGVNWTESGSFRDLGWDHTVKTMDLNEPTPARYLKLVHDETYGQIEGYKDMFLSGNMLNFFEDATKEYIATPVIEYSNTVLTNSDVTAEITLPEGCNIIGATTYVFSANGTHTFKYTDANGVEQSIDATVDWIDKIAPTADVVYSTKEAINGDVVVTLENISDDATIINNGGSPSYTFTANGSFEFILEDKAGNITKIPVAVSWIDKESPIVTVSYSEENKTNKDVIVTISGLKEGEYVENNGGLTTYTFKENGIFEFIVKDAAGNTTVVPTAVNWIDKVVPTATVVYDITDWTSGDVVATLSNISEDVTILGDGLDYHVFKENGTYRFEFVDEAGNIGVAEATVNWIDKTKPTEVVSFDKNKDEVASVVNITLNVNLDEVEILNNGGKAEYTFTKNETFVFKLRLKSTGYEFEVPVTVDWIKEDTNSGSNNGSSSNGTNSGINGGINGGTTDEDITEEDKVEDDSNTDEDITEEDKVEDDSNTEEDKVDNDSNTNDTIEEDSNITGGNNSTSNGGSSSNVSTTKPSGSNSSNSNTGVTTKPTTKPSTKPSNTVKPSNTTKPSNTVKPSTSVKPSTNSNSGNSSMNTSVGSNNSNGTTPTNSTNVTTSTNTSNNTKPTNGTNIAINSDSSAIRVESIVDTVSNTEENNDVVIDSNVEANTNQHYGLDKGEDDLILVGAEESAESEDLVSSLLTDPVVLTSTSMLGVLLYVIRKLFKK